MSLFFIFNKTDVANYADGNMLYTSSNDVNELIKRLEEASKELIKWFDGNLMKANPDKCHLFVSTIVVWMFNSRIIDKKTNRLHERCLKVHQCRFENLPKCSCSYKNDTMKILYFEF